MNWKKTVTNRHKDLQADQKRPRRARLKGWRLGAPNQLSAHPFFGALCKDLWRPEHGGALSYTEVSGAPGRLGQHGGV